MESISSCELSNYQKMIKGKEYDINDGELVDIRFETRDKVECFNSLSASDKLGKSNLLRQMFMRVGDNVHIESPVRLDYGINTSLGSNVFINFNLVVLDCAPVTIGSDVFIAPNVQIYTATHPLQPSLRNQHIGQAEPVTIGDSVWIGGGCIILPGVSIGSGSTIGAGSVVTKSIPPDCLAYGNPCRVVKHLG